MPPLINLLTYDGLTRLDNVKYATTGEGVADVKTDYTYRNYGSSTERTTSFVGHIDYTYAADGLDTNDRFYTYGPAGNILTESRGTESNQILQEKYTYDTKGQVGKHYSVRNNETWVYTYDNAGNILNKKQYEGVTTPDELDAASAPTKDIDYTYSTGAWGDLLTEYDGKAVTSDAIGNMLSYDGQSFTWKGRQLTGYTNADNATTNYTYNADGIRTKKTTGNRTTEFFLNGDQILMMKTTEGTGDDATEDIIWFFYDSQGQRVGLCRNGTYMYYLYNLQGDVMAIASAGTGELVATYKYDTWGNCTVEKKAGYEIGDKNPFRYRGYYWDEESGMYYLNSRYYSPEFGRFISADTTDVLDVQDNLYDKNLFSYCDNNPVMRKDAGGEVWLPLAYGVVGGVIGCAEAILATVMTKGNRKEIIVAGIVGGISGALTAVIPSSKMVIDIGAGIAEEIALQFIGENSSADTAVGIAVSTGSAFTGGESYLTVETGQRYSAALAKTKAGNHPKVKKEAKRIVQTTRKTVRNEIFGGAIGATIQSAFKSFFKNLF